MHSHNMYVDLYIIHVCKTEKIGTNMLSQNLNRYLSHPIDIKKHLPKHGVAIWRASERSGTNSIRLSRSWRLPRCGDGYGARQSCKAGGFERVLEDFVHHEHPRTIKLSQDTCCPVEILRLDCGLDEKLNSCTYSPPHISCYTTSPALFIGATNFGHLRTPTPENCQISERKVIKKFPKVNPGNQLYREPSCPARVILPWMLIVIFMPIHAHILWNHVES